MPPLPQPATLAEFVAGMPSGSHFELTWQAGTPRLVLIDHLWEHHLIYLIRNEYESFGFRDHSYHAVLLPPFVVELVEWFANWGTPDLRYPALNGADVVTLGEVPTWVTDVPRYAALVAAAHSINEPTLPTLAKLTADSTGLDPLSLMALVLDVHQAADDLHDALAASVRALSGTVSRASSAAAL
jgi:hypothetical protein